MSVNSRYRERKYNSSENDRLLRILSQPVQSWEKKWAPSTRSKSHHVHKWVKSDRTIVFEDEDDDEEDEEDKDQVMTEADKDTPGNDNSETAQHVGITSETEMKGESTMTNAGGEGTGLFSMRSPVTNKQVATAAIEEERTHTPKLSDVPDVDPDQIMADNDDDKSNTDDLNDASRHPAYAPHIHPRLTDDDVLGSQSEQTSTDATPKENDDFSMATDNDGNNISAIDNNTTTNTNQPNTIETTATDTTITTAPVAELDTTAISPKPTTDTPEQENVTNTDIDPTPSTHHVPTTTIESVPSPESQQQTQPPPPPPVGTADVDDRLLDAPVKTPDVVFSTNTPGVDTPFDTATPSDMPMQRNINVVTENDTEIDMTPTDPQANDEPAQ